MIHKPLILLVDDEEDLLKVLAKFLQGAGFATASSTGGDQIWDVMHRQKPDLILLDIRLPEISGITIFRDLRKNEKFRDIPVIFISAIPSYQKHCLEDLKAQGFMQKPYQPEALLQKIREILEKK